MLAIRQVYLGFVDPVGGLYELLYEEASARRVSCALRRLQVSGDYFSQVIEIATLDPDLEQWGDRKKV